MKDILFKSIDCNTLSEVGGQDVSEFANHI